jgi:hypothetical protein
MNFTDGFSFQVDKTIRQKNFDDCGAFTLALIEVQLELTSIPTIKF